MKEIEFRIYLEQTNHTEKSILSRISRLKTVERSFHLNIDSIIFDKEKVICLLDKLKEIDSKNQNLSNAVRKYYECMTNNVIEKNYKE